MKGSNRNVHDTLGPQRHCVRLNAITQVSKNHILWAKSFSESIKIGLDATTATQCWLDAFCFFFTSCWPSFSHSYSFPAVLYLTRSSQCEGMAALWFMGSLSLPWYLHSLHSNKTARRVCSSHIKWKRYSGGGKRESGEIHPDFSVVNTSVGSP